MSERGAGFGPFLLGLTVGAVIGFLFAPDAGEVTRGKLTKKLRGLRDLAEEKVGELAEGETGPAALPSAREELERRLAEARRRRRTGKPARAATEEVAEEDEPVA
ncbi:MAG: YtxH domain-containing protein [Gemmatimonadetes bacterium]|nr:YtxH domain-containing protein [Gemmatimonadota bacterium]